MPKKLSQLLVLVLLMLTLSIPSSYGSGKMEVKLGSKVTLQGESKFAGASFKWIVKKGNEIVGTQTNRIFVYTFVSAGDYTVNLTATGRDGGVKNTTIDLLVGDRFPRPAIPVKNSGIVAVTVGADGQITTSDGKTLILSTKSHIITKDGNVVRVQSDGRMLMPNGEFVTLNADGKLKNASGSIFDISENSQLISTDGDYIYLSPTGQIIASDDPDLQFSPTGQVITISGRVLSVSQDGQVLEIQSASDSASEDDLSRAARVVPLKLVVSTLPPMDDSGTVHLYGDSSKVSFYLGDSTGQILEYRIDRNIFIDSDNNGNANDDIDNSSDNSYLTGSSFETTYIANESPKVVSEITLVDKSGRKVKKQIQFVFDTPPSKTGDPIAQLDVSPKPRMNDGFVYLYGNKSEVGFYAKNSPGNIVEYRIDKNIFFDSDGDGNPANDIDNRNDESFKTGDLWMTSYDKTSDQIIAQLIVVGANGKGSRVQVGIKFTDKPQPKYATGGTNVIRLTADKDFVLKGDPITFTVTGLTQKLKGYSFSWDFNGDGTVDQETKGQNVVKHIYEVPSAVDATVKIVDADGNVGTRTLAMVVKDNVGTVANFTDTIDGNTVSFFDTSTVSADLASKKLTYQWSFGDSDEANFISQKDQVNLANPSYIFKKAGTYLVTLTVTDSEDVVNSRSEQVVIQQDLPSVTPAIPNGKPAVNKVSPIKTQPNGGANSTSVIKIILKVILYIIIIAIALVILIFGGLLVLLKIQNPDLTFEELSEEVRMKLLGMLGVHDMVEEKKVPEVPTMPKNETKTKEKSEKIQEAEVVEKSAVKPETKVDSELPVEPGLSAESQKPVEQEPTPEPEPEPEPTPEPEPPAEPETMAGREVIETTEATEEDVPQPSNPPETTDALPETPPLVDPKSGPTPESGSKDEQGPVPDWLKGV